MQKRYHMQKNGWFIESLSRDYLTRIRADYPDIFRNAKIFRTNQVFSDRIALNRIYSPIDNL